MNTIDSGTGAGTGADMDMNSLITQQQGDLDKDALRRLSEKKWVDGIQLLADLSTLVTDPPAHLEEAPLPGEFWLSGHTRLGTTIKNRQGKVESSFFDYISVAARLHASVVDNKELVEETFDANSEAYRRIEAMSRARSSGQGPVARCGIDILMWIPSVKEFGVYFFAKTAKDEGLKIFSQMKDDQKNKKAGTLYRLSSFLKKGSQNSWWMPRFGIAPDQSGIALPEKDAAKSKVDTFLNQKPREKDGPAATAGLDR